MSVIVLLLRTSCSCVSNDYQTVLHCGQVSIVDAYCPHLGANLGVGGRVIGNCIECPFHGWQFDGETGKCTSIPYASKVSVGHTYHHLLPALYNFN